MAPRQRTVSKESTGGVSSINRCPASGGCRLQEPHSVSVRAEGTLTVGARQR